MFDNEQQFIFAECFEQFAELTVMISKSSKQQMATGKPDIKSHRNSSIASAKINFLPWYWETQWGQSIQRQTLQSLLYASASQAEEMYKTGSWLALHSVQFKFMLYFCKSFIITNRICLIFQSPMIFICEEKIFIIVIWLWLFQIWSDAIKQQ